MPIIRKRIDRIVYDYVKMLTIANIFMSLI